MAKKERQLTEHEKIQAAKHALNIERFYAMRLMPTLDLAWQILIDAGLISSMDLRK